MYERGHDGSYFLPFSLNGFGERIYGNPIREKLAIIYNDANGGIISHGPERVMSAIYKELKLKYTSSTDIRLMMISVELGCPTDVLLAMLTKGGEIKRIVDTIVSSQPGPVVEDK